MEHVVQHIIDVASRLGNWGYLLIFLVILLECQAVLGLFIPGESLVLVAGFLAGQAVFDLEPLVIAIAAGATMGDSIGYELGRLLGRAWLRRHGPRVGIRERHFDAIDRFIARHGGKSVLLSHFMHVLRALMPFMAGANRMGYARFLSFNVIGCVLWAAIFSTLGFFVGESWQIVDKWIGRAGALVGVVAVLLVATTWLWGWMVRHEVELRTQWGLFLRRPRVAAFRRRFAREIEFVEARLTPGGYLGLHLTTGALIFLLAGWWFGGVVQDLIAQDPLVAVDNRLAEWFNAHATHALTRVAEGVTFFGSWPFSTAAATATVIVLAVKRSWHRAFMTVLAVGGGTLLNLALKDLFHRSRPVLPHPLIVLDSYGFPSGHTIGATLFFGLTAFFVMQTVHRWRWRVLAPLIAVLMILLVALSRLYLGAHFLSDVLGAMALGIMWLSFSITAVEIDRRYRRHHRPAGAGGSVGR